MRGNEGLEIAVVISDGDPKHIMGGTTTVIGNCRKCTRAYDDHDVVVTSEGCSESFDQECLSTSWTSFNEENVVISVEVEDTFIDFMEDT